MFTKNTQANIAIMIVRKSIHQAKRVHLIESVHILGVHILGVVENARHGVRNDAEGTQTSHHECVPQTYTHRCRACASADLPTVKCLNIASFATKDYAASCFRLRRDRRRSNQETNVVEIQKPFLSCERAPPPA